MVRTIILAGLLVATASAEVGTGWIPEILGADSKVYLPDFSYAGYHNGEKPLPRLKPTISVTDFGAVPDDGKDDTEAIKQAIAKAAANDDPDVIGFPKGRFVVSEILIVDHSHVVLQGAGSGPDGTTLYFPKAMNELPLQPESQTLFDYLVKGNKRHGKKLFSPFSWAGGLIWFKSPHYGGTEPVAQAVDGVRGEYTIGVKDSSGLKPGIFVLLQWFNRDGETGSFLEHLYMAKNHKCGSRFYESPDNPIVQQPVRITAVNGSKVTIKEPLLHDVRPEWTPQLVAFKPIEEVGVESLRIEFPHRTREWKHHLEDGFNGIYLTQVRNSWVQDVEVHNADSAILIEKTASLVTIESVRITGNVMGHYTIECGGYGNLIKNFIFTAPAGHSPSFNTGCNYCIFTQGSVDKPFIDQHCGGNHQNLIDDVTLTTIPAKLFNHGGASYYYPAAGAYNTFWNLFVESGSAKIGGLKGNGKCPAWHARIVGLHGKKDLTLEYSSSACIEGLNRAGIAVPSLYEYQLKKRKDAEYDIGKKMPADAVITCPDSNPLRDALRPVPETAVFKMEGWSLWDPSLIKVGDTYHLFCSRWPQKNDHSFNSGWMRSHVIRATSKNLFGPYTFQEVVMHPKDHPWATQGISNPKITKVGDKFLLYHLGIPKWSTGFAYADSIEGPWKPVPKPVVRANNPALLVHDDGSAYMVSKFKPKPTKDGKWDACMRAHEADNVNGPYRVVGDNGNRLPYGFELEDPTIWWANNQYNVICTDWEGKVTGIQKPVVYYTSKDGINYELYSDIPVWTQTEPILLEDGTQLEASRIERPQVYINDEGEFAALLVAVGVEERSHDYIVIRPVDNFVPSN